MASLELRTPSVEDIHGFIHDKLYEHAYDKSLLLKLYRSIETQAQVAEHVFALAVEGINPVGIAVIQKIAPQEHPLVALDGTCNRNSKPRFTMNKSFFGNGFLQVYVRPECRGQGIAKGLVRLAEQEYLRRLDTELTDERLPLLVALDAAHAIADRHLEYCYVLRTVRPYGNLARDIDRQAWKYRQLVGGEVEGRGFLREAHERYRIQRLDQPVRKRSP